MQRKTGQIRMRVELGNKGKLHEEATCNVSRYEMTSAESTTADGRPLHKATRVKLTIHADAEKDFPIHIVLDAESATRLAADMLDWLAPRTLLPRNSEDSGETS